MSDWSQTIAFPNSGLDRDTSPQFLQPGDGRYRMNIAVSNIDMEGILENEKGCVGRALVNLPTGTNTIIGGCENIQDQSFIYFMHNSNGLHCIWQYNSRSDTIVPVLYTETILNFNTSYPVQAVIIGGMLYWTDGYNPPRSVNVVDAIAFTHYKYQEGISYWAINVDFVVS